jgi:hypothetical protein
MGEINRPLNTRSVGDASITFPDVCKTPAPPAPFVPVPYPNFQLEKNLKKANKVDALALTGDRKAIALQKKAVSNLVMSQGDEAGTLKGVKSASQAVRMGYTLNKGGVGKPQAGKGMAIKMGLSVYANGRKLDR